jgi:hypothetical protein
MFRNLATKDGARFHLPWMAFGYGVSITPLQTLTFYNAVANQWRNGQTAIRFRNQRME